MTESFAQLFEESLKEIETRPGSIVRGVVVAIDKDVVLVDAGLKSESAIPAEQFKNAQGELEIQVGDEVDVALDAVEDGFGETWRIRDSGVLAPVLRLAVIVKQISPQRFAASGGRCILMGLSVMAAIPHWIRSSRR